MSRYTIKIIDNETGIVCARPIECDGYLAAGFVAGKQRYETLRLRMDRVSVDDLTDAMYTDPKLRAAARKMVKQLPKKRTHIWRRLFGGKKA